MDKTELMAMAREAGFHMYDMSEIGHGQSVEADSFSSLESFANAILERAAVAIKEASEANISNASMLSEWGKGWSCGANDAAEGAVHAIRALKITEGGGA